MKPIPKPRRKGKALPEMQPATVRTVLIGQAMELRDDLTLVRMRLDELIKLLLNNA